MNGSVANTRIHQQLLDEFGESVKMGPSRDSSASSPVTIA